MAGMGIFVFSFPRVYGNALVISVLFLNDSVFFYLVEGPSISLYLYFTKKKNPKSLAVHSMVNILRKRRGLMHSLWCKHLMVYGIYMNRFSFTYFPFNLINKRLKKKIIIIKKVIREFF